MKRLIISLAVLAFFSGTAFAQLRIAYVDSDTIMDQLPDAQDAREKLDALVKEWQAELKEMEDEWQKKYDDYEKRKLIMTDETRADVEKELTQLEQQIGQYREKKFGANGELFQKQDELMTPIQNRVFTVINEIADEEDYDFVFDRSGDILLLYAKEEYDITNDVIEKLQLIE